MAHHNRRYRNYQPRNYQPNPTVFKEDKDNVKIKQDTELCSPCIEYDGTKEYSVAFCFHCVDYLCSSCMKEHQKNKKTRNHVLMQGTEKSKNQKAIQFLKKVMSCQEHPTTELTHHCKEHAAFICQKCMTTVHKQCKDLTDIDNKESDEGRSQTILHNLQQITDSSKKIITLKAENLKKIATDGFQIDQERKKIINDIVQHLRKLEDISKQKTDKIIMEQKSLLDKETENLQAVNKEFELDKDIMKLVLQHSTKGTQEVVFEYIQNKIKQKRAELQSYQIGKERRIKFEQCMQFDKSMELGTASMFYLVENHEYQVRQLDLSSDEYAEADSVGGSKAVTKQKKPKPIMPSLMTQKLSETETKYKIKCANDSQICSVSGAVTLDSSLIVILDKNNKKLKVFDKDLYFLQQHKFEANAKAICKIGKTLVAVTYEQLKQIDIYEIENDKITHKTRIGTEFCGSSITSSQNGDILISSSQKKGLQILDKDGIVKRRIEKFRDRYGHNVQFDSSSNIHFVQSSQLIISGKHMMRVFELGNTSHQVLNERWFYRSNGNHTLNDASDVCMDSDGNIYVCGRLSNNVHQISGRNHQNNRLLVSNIIKPVLIQVDSVRGRMMVGCENDDYIHVFQFCI